MKLILRFYAGHLVVSVAALAAGMLLGGWTIPAAAGLAIGALWFYSVSRGSRGVETMFLILMELLTAAGFYWFNISPVLAVLASAGALGAWDLDFFLQRMRQGDRIDQERWLGWTHIKRLLLAEGVGLAIALPAITVHPEVPLWLDLLLIFLGVIGISQLIRFVRSQTEQPVEPSPDDPFANG